MGLFLPGKFQMDSLFSFGGWRHYVWALRSLQDTAAGRAGLPTGDSPSAKGSGLPADQLLRMLAPSPSVPPEIALAQEPPMGDEQWLL